jgi:hypothetical protein
MASEHPEAPDSIARQSPDPAPETPATGDLKNLDQPGPEADQQGKTGPRQAPPPDPTRVSAAPSVLPQAQPVRSATRATSLAPPVSQASASAQPIHQVDLSQVPLAVPENVPSWGPWHTVLVVGSAGVILPEGIVAQPWLATHNFPAARWLSNSLSVQNGRLILWLAQLLLLLALLAVIGHGITGRVEGILIDGRNRMSLSRFQLVIWTVIVLSSFYTAVLWRLSAHAGTPTDLAIPQELWLALGISVTSFVGTPLILNTKTGRPADGAQTEQTFRQLVSQRTARLVNYRAERVPR